MDIGRTVGVFAGMSILSIISILLIIGSLGVLIFWTRKRKYGSGIIGKGGMVLHIIYLGIFFSAYLSSFPSLYKITRYVMYFVTIPYLPFLVKLGLIIFQMWLGFTILFESKKQTPQQYMGIVPILSALFLGFLLSLITGILMGVIVYFYQSSRKGGPAPARATIKTSPSTIPSPKKPTLDFQTSEQKPALDIQPIPQEPDSVACITATLTVQSADLPKLKENGPAFSDALAGKTIKLQNRLVFQDITIIVTQVEPDKLVTITSETKIKMRSTEEDILLFCSSCGTVQEKVQESCTQCGTSLPVIEL